MRSSANEGAPRRGEAGPVVEAEGEELRSDLHVAVEERPGGGIEVDLVSKVEPYYGESIRRQAASVLSALGVRHARVAMEDGGGLPFVITARLEAAARSAGLFAGPSPFARDGAEPPAPRRDRLRRSRLYLPGNEPKFMINAGLHGPDGVILDLEDSVAPDHKDGARSLVYHALLHIDFGGSERMVRINQLPLGLADLDLVIPAQPDVILIPKAETRDQVEEVDRRIQDTQKRLGTGRPVFLMPILESALGIENAFSIVSASPNVVALTIGLEDYTADLGVVKTLEGAETLFARMRIVNAARAAGCQAIDSVFGDVLDLEGLRAWAIRSRAMGFEGMGCIHPRQIRVIHEAFAPTAAEIERALSIVQAFEEAKARGLAVISLGSKMIDPPVVSRALKLVELARAMGLVPEAPGKEGGR